MLDAYPSLRGARLEIGAEDGEGAAMPGQQPLAEQEPQQQ